MPPMDPLEREALADRVIEALTGALGPQLQSAILKGSAVAGDFIPWYSDFDVHCFVASDALVMPGVLRLEYALATQEALARVDAGLYRVNYVQVHFVDAAGGYPDGWPRPVPGSYAAVAGEPPPWLNGETRTAYRAAAAEAVAAMPQEAVALTARIADMQDGKLARLVRYAGTKLKPALRSLSVCQGEDPFEVIPAPVDALLDDLEKLGAPAASARKFYEGAHDWQAVSTDPERLRIMLRLAVQSLEELGAWGTERGHRRGR